MKTENVIQEKSYAFAIRIINLYRYLTEKKVNMFCQNNYYGVELLLERMLKKG